MAWRGIRGHFPPLPEMFVPACSLPLSFYVIALKWGDPDGVDLDRIGAKVGVGDACAPPPPEGHLKASLYITPRRIPPGKQDALIVPSLETFDPIGCDEAEFLQLLARADLIEIDSLEGECENARLNHLLEMGLQIGALKTLPVPCGCFPLGRVLPSGQGSVSRQCPKSREIW